MAAKVDRRSTRPAEMWELTPAYEHNDRIDIVTALSVRYGKPLPAILLGDLPDGYQVTTDRPTTERTGVHHVTITHHRPHPEVPELSHDEWTKWVAEQGRIDVAAATLMLERYAKILEATGNWSVETVKVEPNGSYARTLWLRVKRA